MLHPYHMWSADSSLISCKDIKLKYCKDYNTKMMYPRKLILQKFNENTLKVRVLKEYFLPT